jgi:uncharacterized membrane protein YcaP (DUF421 family)
VFAYLFLLVLLRLAGKRTVAQGNTPDFVLAVVLGDMIDDALWAEVSAAQFSAGAGILCFLRVALGQVIWRVRAISR